MIYKLERIEMKIKIKATKSKLYKLAYNILEDLPKMKDTQFISHRGKYWLKYQEVKHGNNINIYFDYYLGSPYFLIYDITKGESRVIHLDVDDLEKRGMIREIR